MNEEEREHHLQKMKNRINTTMEGERKDYLQM